MRHSHCHFQPRDLLKQYEKLDKDPNRFIHWMKKQCQANTGHAKKTFAVVNGFISGEKDALIGKPERQNNIPIVSSDTLKKYSISTPKMLLQSSKNVQHANLNDKNIKPVKLLPTIKKPNSCAQPTLILKDTSIEPKNENSKPLDKNSDNEDGSKDALNQHLIKLRQQFSNMQNSANRKMLELQSELGKMQHMSHEFDVLAEFLTSEEKLSIFEQNLDRLQKTVHLTEEKLSEINTNNQKMGRMIRQINDTAKRQHDNNDKAINAIGDRLARWETKLDRVARKLSNQKIDVEEFKMDKDYYGQMKGDIEHMLTERLAELSTDMDKMKNVVLCIISLVVLKMFVFDLFKNDVLVNNSEKMN